MTNTYYIGLDVHKETTSIAYALGGSREEATFCGQCGGSIAASTKALPNPAPRVKSGIPSSLKLKSSAKKPSFSHQVIRKSLTLSSKIKTHPA